MGFKTCFRRLFYAYPFRKKNSGLLQHIVFYLYNMR